MIGWVTKWDEESENGATASRHRVFVQCISRFHNFMTHHCDPRIWGRRCEAKFALHAKNDGVMLRLSSQNREGVEELGARCILCTERRTAVMSDIFAVTLIDQCTAPRKLISTDKSAQQADQAQCQKCARLWLQNKHVGIIIA